MRTPATVPTPSNRRASAARRRAIVRADAIAHRIGIGLRDARRAQGIRQIDVATAAGLAQPHYSRIERGVERGASLLALTACASALDVQLAAFIEALPGASLPRDIEHARRQSLLIELAASGGWSAAPEAALHNDGPRPRSIDVLLTRVARREAAVVEIWDLLLDVGDAMRGHEAKVLETRRRLGPDWHVHGLFLLRQTHRNRALVRDLAPLINARFPAPSRRWLRSLTDPSVPMPDAAGFAWTSVRGDRLIAARLG